MNVTAGNIVVIPGHPYSTLLAGRSARLLVTMDSPPWYHRWVMRQPGHQMMRPATLGFSGVRPVRTSEFGSVRGASDQARGRWLDRARQLGQQDGSRAAKAALRRR